MYMAKKSEVEEVNKSQAVREAVEKLGTEASNDEVRTEVLKQYPQLKEWADTPAFSTYAYAQRKRLTQGQQATAQAVTPAKPGQKTTTPDVGEPTISDLLRVKELASEHKGGLKELDRLLNEVEKWTEAVGSFEKLKACVKALAQLTE
jgi:hypothetical protein